LREYYLDVICVDIPDGSVDISNVEEAVAKFPGDTIVIRSTVPPGTTARLAERFGKAIFFWPEYVGETTFLRSAGEAFQSLGPFIVGGGVAEARGRVIDILLPALGPEVRRLSCSSGEAEMVKYAKNAYFATKVDFVTELRALCRSRGLDWHTLRERWLLDTRVERDHTTASPGRHRQLQLADHVNGAHSVGARPLDAVIWEGSPRT
jgi:UDPglucose 6-dehydrogenase